MNDIVMPRLSDSMTEGTVVRWLKQPGEAVVRGEPIVEIETDKATITYEADLDGVLADILVVEGQTVPVGARIARIEASGGAESVVTDQAPPVTQEFSPGVPPPPATPAPPAVPPPPAATAPEHAAEPGGRVKASPIARRLARKLGVDIEQIAGTGPGGRIVKEDVEAAAASPPSAQPPPTQAAAEPPLEFDLEPDAPAIAESYEQPAETTSTPVAPQPLPLPPGAEPAEQFQGYSGEEPALTPPPGALPPLPQTPPVYAPHEPYAPSTVPGLPPLPQPPVAPAAGYPGGVPAMPPGPPPAGYPQPAAGQLPGPAPFVSGMTGGFPAISPQSPGGPAPGGQPPPQAPAGPGLTATRGQSYSSAPSSAQQTVARRMAESKATAPDFFVEVEVDMTNAVNYREQLKQAVRPAPSFNDMVIKACALALRQFPKVNGAYRDGHFEQYGDVNVGFVVAAGELLAMPTVFNADQKGLAQIARESRELADAVRGRTIQPGQLSGGTFSVSNLGMYGVERFTAILNPPQAAILAVGAIKRRPVIAEDGVSLAVRQTMSLTITCDHRILYGTDGAEFLTAVKAWLESPQALPL